MQITYNFLNLPSVIKRGTAVKALYSFYADGSKSRVIDASGTGYDYMGSFKYARKGNTLTLESVTASGGRIHKTATGYEVRYHVMDHLGSVRLVTNASGTILEQNDYHPYGTRHANAGHATTPNPYLYGGKELQQDFGVNYYDSHARFQTNSGIFLSIDPQSERMPGVSPYAYCGGNPIVRHDPTGEIWDVVWDAGNVIYDAGAAIYNHAVGNHKQARSHWADAGVDLTAALIPFVPAGSTKLLKAGDKVLDAVKAVDRGTDVAKGLDNVSDAAKTGQKVKNPYGSKGRPDHKAKVKELSEKAGKELQPKEEVLMEKKIQAEGSNRRPDVQILDGDGKTRKIYEAERHPESVRNMRREEEYRNLGIPFETHPLN